MAAVIAITVVGLFFALEKLVQQSKEAIRHELEQAVGRAVAFDTLELSFWGPPSLAFNNVTVQDNPRFAATPFVHSRRLKVSVRWLSLLRGEPEITSLVLEEPEIQLIRDEDGNLNIFETDTLESTPHALPPLRLPATGVQANGGSLHFIDRSSDPPAELHLRDLSITLFRSEHNTIHIDIAGTLADEESKPFLVKGAIGPVTPEPDWSQSPIDLEIQVASLPRAIVSRSLAVIADRVPPYLHVSGPLEISAHLVGTIAEPRVTKATVKGALFGANFSNATLEAAVDFANDAAPDQGLIQARFDIEKVTLDQVKQVPWVGRLLPQGVVVEGVLDIHNMISGKLGALRVETTLNAQENQIRYGRWFIKPQGVRADMRLTTRFGPDEIIIEDSAGQVYNAKFSLSGSVREKPEQVVQLFVKTASVPLVGWEELLPYARGYEIDGTFAAELSLHKKSSPQDEPLLLHGRLELSDTHAISKKPGERNFESVNADFLFQGADIEIRNLQLRSGASDVALKGQLTSLSKPKLYYSLQARKLRLSDITQRSGHKNDLFHHLGSEGVAELVEGSASVKGDFSSSDGRLNEASYRNLRATLDWSPQSLKFKDVSFESLGGSVEMYGSVLADPEHQFRVRVSPTVRDVDMKQLLEVVSPNSLGAVSGRLDFDGQFTGAGEDWETVSRTLNGQGRIDLHDGAIEKFNLMQGVLASLGAVQGIRGITAAGPGFTSLVQSGQTRFSRITSTFRIEKGRLFSDDVMMTSPDYVIRSDGWLDADGRMDWEANLVLSSEFSRELSANQRNVRYLLDDRDVMSIPFRLKGRTPSLEVRPEVTQLLRFMHARAQEEKSRRTHGGKNEAAESGLWNSFRQSSDDLWNSFRQLFR